MMRPVTWASNLAVTYYTRTGNLTYGCKKNWYLMLSAGIDNKPRAKSQWKPSQRRDWTRIHNRLSLFGTNPEVIKSEWTNKECRRQFYFVPHTPKPSSKYTTLWRAWLRQCLTRGAHDFGGNVRACSKTKGQSNKLKIFWNPMENPRKTEKSLMWGINLSIMVYNGI